FTVAEIEPDVIERRALMNTGRAKGVVTFNGVFDWTAEDFAIRNVALAPANNGRDPFNAETQIGSRTFDLHPIRFFHESLQRFHARLQLSVIQRANLEKEILESLRAHAGLLCHRRGWPAQH